MNKKNLQTEHKEIPIFTKLILGKIFDYKYSEEKEIESGIFKFTIDIPNSLEEASVISDRNKKEIFLNKDFKLYTELEKELALIKEKITEEKEDFKLSIQFFPLYPKGSTYLIRVLIKKELQIDFNMLSDKNKFNYNLKNKLVTKNIKYLKINKI